MSIPELISKYDIRRHTGRCCVNCPNWQKKDPEDWEAPEGRCTLPEDPNFWPFGYWPNTLASDGCSKFGETP